MHVPLTSPAPSAPTMCLSAVSYSLCVTFHCFTCSAQPGAEAKWHALPAALQLNMRSVLPAVQEMEKKSDKANAAAVAGTNDGEGGGGRFAALLDTIIGNLELRISNIHIRYEDPVSNPGHTFSIGIMLSDISAHTVDEAGKRAFVTTNALATLRKVSEPMLQQQVVASIFFTEGVCIQQVAM